MCAIYDCDVCMCRMFSATAKVSIKKLLSVSRPSNATSQFIGTPGPRVVWPPALQRGWCFSARATGQVGVFSQ
jgi:hypothetical protein